MNQQTDSLQNIKKYVRVRGIVNSTFVEFDFAIGYPDLFVELVLPKPAFEAFCRNNHVEMMSEEQCEAVDRELVKWRYGEGGLAGYAEPQQLSGEEH